MTTTNGSELEATVNLTEQHFTLSREYTIDGDTKLATITLVVYPDGRMDVFPNDTGVRGNNKRTFLFEYSRPELARVVGELLIVASGMGSGEAKLSEE